MDRLNKTFCLRVRRWPCFKTSFFYYRKMGLCIPFEYKYGGDEDFDYPNGSGGFLKMICYDPNCYGELLCGAFVILQNAS